MGKQWCTLEKEKTFGELKQLWSVGDEWTWGVVDRIHIHTECTARHHIYTVGSKDAEIHTLDFIMFAPQSLISHYVSLV